MSERCRGKVHRRVYVLCQMEQPCVVLVDLKLHFIGQSITLDQRWFHGYMLLDINPRFWISIPDVPVCNFGCRLCM